MCWSADHDMSIFSSLLFFRTLELNVTVELLLFLTGRRTGQTSFRAWTLSIMWCGRSGKNCSITFGGVWYRPPREDPRYVYLDNSKALYFWKICDALKMCYINVYEVGWKANRLLPSWYTVCFEMTWSAKEELCKWPLKEHQKQRQSLFAVGGVEFHAFLNRWILIFFFHKCR